MMAVGAETAEFCASAQMFLKEGRALSQEGFLGAIVSSVLAVGSKAFFSCRSAASRALLVRKSVSASIVGVCQGSSMSCGSGGAFLVVAVVGLEESVGGALIVVMGLPVFCAYASGSMPHASISNETLIRRKKLM